MGCETKVMAEIPSSCASDATIPITGVIDRLDVLHADDAEAARDGGGGSGGSSSSVIVTDYKTGRAPPPRYRDEAFFQLEVYALLLHETGRAARRVRLLFLGGGGDVLERAVDEDTLARTRERLQDIWRRILAAFREDAFLPTTTRLCEWCAHKSTCPAFAGLEGTDAAEPPAQPASAGQRQPADPEPEESQ